MAQSNEIWELAKTLGIGTYWLYPGPATGVLVPTLEEALRLPIPPRWTRRSYVWKIRVHKNGQRFVTTYSDHLSGEYEPICMVNIEEEEREARTIGARLNWWVHGWIIWWHDLTRGVHRDTSCTGRTAAGDSE